jgi:hypothetical protein
LAELLTFLIIWLNRRMKRFEGGNGSPGDSLQ